MKDNQRAGSHYLFLAVALVAACMLCAIAWPVFDLASAQNSNAKFNGKIAFVSNRNGPPGEIYVMNPDGTNQQNITNSPASETRPAFSHDGKKIAFVKDFNAIYLMNPDGSGKTLVFDGAVSGFTSITSFPDWSPDDAKIVFNAIPKGSQDGGDIYVVSADGTGLTRLTTDPANDTTPAWSPDGTKIAFASIRNPVPSEVNYEIYVMNADGSNQTRITNNTKFDLSPAWSPDGTRIAFTSRRDDDFEVYVMNADGSNQTRLTNSPEQDSDAKWSPDGTKMIFLSSRGGRFGEIWTMNPDGTGPVNLTNTDNVFEMDPSWQTTSAPFVPSSPTPTPTPSPSPTPSPGGISWEAFVPSPNQIELDVLSCGDKSFAKVRITFNDSGYRVADWGQVEKSNNNLSVDIKAERMVGGLSAQVITSFDRVYDLGTLAPGTWNFIVKSRGATLKNKFFNVGGVGANPADDASVFVSQHYVDFLGRNPDDQGFGFWIRNLTSGCGTDAACLERKRIDTSAAFFLSIEFQRTGFFVYRLYRASFGRMPRREELIPDARTAAVGVIVNMPGWESVLTDNEHAFTDEWVNRADFRFDFDQLSDAQFVDRLTANTGGSIAPGTRTALIDDLAAGRQTRAGVLRAIVDDGSFASQEFNSAFVLMEYFGYLQRNPDERPDTDMSGFNFWLKKLNQFGGDYVKADMVKAFINSTEYRARFCGP